MELLQAEPPVQVLALGRLHPEYYGQRIGSWWEKPWHPEYYGQQISSSVSDAYNSVDWSHPEYYGQQASEWWNEPWHPEYYGQQISSDIDYYINQVDWQHPEYYGQAASSWWNQPWHPEYYGQQAQSYYYYQKDRLTWKGWLVVGTFLPMFIAHLWVMMFPLHWWCEGNAVMRWYTWVTLVQLIAAYMYALESPYWLMMTSAQRMAPTVISMVVAGIWSVQVIILVYDVITKGDIWQNLASVIQAYLIVIGLPNAIFSVYVYVMHQWWEWFYKQGGFYVPPPPQPEVIIDPTPTPAPKPTPKPNPWLCSENNWTCWEDLGRVCKGTTCNDKCFDHPEFKGTDKEGTDPNFKCHQQNPEPTRFDSHFCYILDNGMHWCGPITNTEQYGYLPKGFPLNLDGSPVDPSLYNPLTNFSPIYVYYFPEQWNPANPLYPLPPYPNRPAPPTQAELDAAAAQYGPGSNSTSTTNSTAPVILVNQAHEAPYAF